MTAKRATGPMGVRAAACAAFAVILSGWWGAAWSQGAAASPAAGATGGVQQCGGSQAGDPAVDCTGAGNPINVATGNKYQREVDLPALPGVLGLELVRHYNSVLSHEREPSGILGKGWRLGYEYALYVIGNAYQIVEPDGRRRVFARSSFDPDLCVSSDPMQGRVRIARRPEGVQYLWTEPSGRSWRFNARGQLEEMRVASGEFVSLQYDARGRLSQVTDPQGRRLLLSYGEGSHGSDRGAGFQGVTRIQTPVGEFRYAYGSSPSARANLISASLPPRPDGRRVNRQYLYEDAKFPFFLTGVAVQSMDAADQGETRRLATYLYDPEGRARRSEHGAAVELQGLEMASPVLGAQPGRVVLVHSQTSSHPQGRALEVLSRQIGGQYRITQTRGEPCPVHLSCPQANVRYEYDRLGRMTRAVAHALPDVQHGADGWRFGAPGPMLGGLRFERDGLGRVVRRWQLPPAASKHPAGIMREVLLEELAYDGLSDRITWRRRPSVVPGQWHDLRVRYNPMGQILSMTESGWRPALAGQPAQPIERGVTREYRLINGRSVPVAVDGPLSGPADSTRYDWDARGAFVLAVKAPLGLVHRFEREGSGRVVREVPPDGVVIDHAQLATGEERFWQRGPAKVVVMHDALGRPTRLDLPDGEVQRLAYESTSGAVASANQSGAMRWVVPPPASMSEPATTTDEVQRVRPALPSPWAGQRVWFDDFGQLVGLQTTMTGLEVRAYDAGGRLVMRTLADGTVWRWQRDVLGRIVSHEASQSEASPIITRLTYEGVHLVKVEHPMESEVLRHDVLGRVLERSVRRPARDGWPEQHWVEHFAHDQADRLVRHELPEGGALNYTWGPGRQLRSITHEDGPWRAVLGGRVAAWLGAGQRVLIEPLTKVETRPTRSAAASGGATPWMAHLQGEQGYRWGNGVALRWRLNAIGQLAEMRYSASPKGHAGWPALVRALPLADAQATEPGASLLLPGLNWTYRYDDWGRMVSRGDTDFVYDRWGRLLVAQSATHKGAADFYAYQGMQRVASREQGPGTSPAQDHDWRLAPVARNASGLPTRLSHGNQTRALRYSADHRLEVVSQEGRPLARYAHNTHGQRIGKQVASDTPRTFLWSQGRLAAEGHDRRIDRRYVYARGVPVAVIDHPGGAQGVAGGAGVWMGLQRWASSLWQLLTQPAPKVTYLHGNEIGTPVAATNANGQVVWRAEHSAFGALRVAHRPTRSASEDEAPFELNLRLPGQYFDVETGWHDNVLRTYDPQRGEYLEPDPLGPGPNWGPGAGGRWLTQPLAYAGNNPVMHADPSGLILFAFDGTGNSDPAQSGSSLSNVRKFFLSYDQTVNGEAFYITGIGTWNKDMSFIGSTAVGTGFRERLNLGTEFLERFINTDATNSGTWLNVDVVGFSRGAAEARAWVSEIERQLSASRKFSSNITGKNWRCINFRFLGLWDTVPHLGPDHEDEKNYDFSIPGSVKFAAHAVAVNEHRGGLADFDVESIHANATAQNSGNRIERGFVGAHSDIGGGYGEGDLSDVALMWMIQNATAQGIGFDRELIKNAGWAVVRNPVVHDSRIGHGFKEWLWLDGGDREMGYLNGIHVKQEAAQLPAGVTNTAKAKESIQEFKTGCGNDGTIVGLVDVAKYKAWVSDIGVSFDPNPIAPAGCLFKY